MIRIFVSLRGNRKGRTASDEKRACNSLLLNSSLCESPRPFVHLNSGCFIRSASGLRNYNSGGMGNVSSVGYNWSASLNGATNGYNLRFDSESVNPSNSNNRANGFPVRCLQVFTASRR